MLIYKIMHKSRIGFAWVFFGMINRALIISNWDIVSKLESEKFFRQQKKSGQIDNRGLNKQG